MRRMLPIGIDIEHEINVLALKASICRKKISTALDEFLLEQDLALEQTVALLTKFKKQTAQNLDIAPYKITRDAGLAYSWRFGNQMFYDAPYTFVLCHNNLPISSISFEFEPGAVLVSQIQGVAGQKEKLAPLKSQRMLLTLVCDWAQENEIPKARVLPHHKNKWQKVKEHGKTTYDVTAIRCGFEYDKQIEMYVKKLL